VWREGEYESDHHEQQKQQQAAQAVGMEEEWNDEKWYEKVLIQ
jgi:hypothetical protein